MSNLNELITIQEDSAAIAKREASKALVSSGGGGYLPYISLMQGTSKLVKTRKAQDGDFVLTKGKEAITLGNKFIGLFIDWRAKAMDYRGDVRSFYDTESTEFQGIVDRCDNSSGNPQAGYGAEFLVWVWEIEQPCFACYFMGSKSMRQEAGNLTGPLEKGPVCKIQTAEMIEGKKGTFFVPQTLAFDQIPSTMPEQSELDDVLAKFRNPPASTEEAVEEAEESDDR